jgi:hypothetical protein
MTNALSGHTKTSKKQSEQYWKTEQYWKKQCMLLIERVEKLEAENKELRATIARLMKDSGTSSKPPSSDMFKDDVVSDTENGTTEKNTNTTILKNQSLREKTGRTTGGQP